MNRSHSLFLAIALVFGCAENDPNNDGSTDNSSNSLGGFNYEDIEFPAHFEVPATGGMGGMAGVNGASVIDTDNTPSDNPITNAGASLGRVLFYDKNLSANGTIACASCHKSEFGFADDRTLSLGFEGGETGRHSMALTNARFYEPGMFFWDQRAETLEDQVLMPFQDEVEMGMTLESLIETVASQDFYPALFDSAFGDGEVTSDRISKALAQFVRSLVSYRSPYDEGRAAVSSANTDFPTFNDEENLGKEIFMGTPMDPNGGGCAVCHQGETMAAAEANNNGLDVDSVDDTGYGEVTGSTGDMGTFKVPSLRNIAVRGGFMHDGRFSTLREVIDHYGDTVEAHPNLGMPLNMHIMELSVPHREALVAFLETLTDEEMLNDPKFSNPFDESGALRVD